MRGSLKMHKATRDDRGATMVEYALAVALVVVGTIGGISKIVDSGDDVLGSSGNRVGSADDTSYYAGATTTSSTTPSSTTSTTALPGTAVQPSSITATPPPSNAGNKWIANATVAVTMSSSPFSGVAGLLVEGEWTLVGGGSVDAASCTTTASGTCTVQRTDIVDAKPVAVFTITAISGPGFYWTPGPGDATTLAVGCSPPLDISCD